MELTAREKELLRKWVKSLEKAELVSLKEIMEKYEKNEKDAIEMLEEKHGKQLHEH